MTREEAKGILKKKPTVIPEYALTEKVILGSDLVSDFGFKNTAIPQAILDAGADIVIIGSQMARDGLDSHQFDIEISALQTPHEGACHRYADVSLHLGP